MHLQSVINYFYYYIYFFFWIRNALYQSYNNENEEMMESKLKYDKKILTTAI